MILAINIGNTNTVVGMHDGEWVHIIRVPTAGYKSAEELLQQIEKAAPCRKNITGGFLASVVPEKSGIVAQAIQKWSGLLPQQIKTPFGLGLDFSPYDSSLLGVDRVLCCIGALSKYAAPFAVFDLGTATSISVVDQSGAFAGGAILAGVRMSLDALVKGTSLLPAVEPSGVPPVIGKNTAECMAAGAVYGMAGAIDGYAGRIKSELGDGVSLLATGGNANNVLSFCTQPFMHEPELLLDGLLACCMRQA